MGGYNSGRSGWRGVIEHRKRLDVRVFRGWGVLGRSGSAGAVRWWNGDDDAGSISYLIENDGGVRLDYTVADDDGERHPIRYWLATTRIPCRYGGHRHYWRCPWCSRRCEVLAIAQQGREWACRKCLRLRYHSQGLTPAYRLQARADKIYAQLGALDSDFVPKPKWMRWRTFNRRMDLANELASRADGQFLWRLRRFGFPGFDEAMASVLGDEAPETGTAGGTPT